MNAVQGYPAETVPVYAPAEQQTMQYGPAPVAPYEAAPVSPPYGTAAVSPYEPAPAPLPVGYSYESAYAPPNSGPAYAPPMSGPAYSAPAYAPPTAGPLYAPAATGPLHESARVRVSGGIGAVLSVLGVLSSAAGLGLLAWVSKTSYTDLYKSVQHQPRPSGAKATFVHYFIGGGAWAAASVGAMLALLWTFGVIGRRVVQRRSLARTRVTISGIQAALAGVQLYGVWVFFDGHFNAAKIGPWVMLIGAGLVLLASLIGPSVRRPSEPAVANTWR